MANASGGENGSRRLQVSSSFEQQQQQQGHQMRQQVAAGYVAPAEAQAAGASLAKAQLELRRQQQQQQQEREQQIRAAQMTGDHQQRHQQANHYYRQVQVQVPQCDSGELATAARQQANERDCSLPAPARRNSKGAATTQVPAACSKEEIDLVFNRLMELDAFRKLHPTVIRNLCSYASIERIDKGVIGK